MGLTLLPPVTSTRSLEWELALALVSARGSSVLGRMKPSKARKRGVVFFFLKTHPSAFHVASREKSHPVLVFWVESISQPDLACSQGVSALHITPPAQAQTSLPVPSALSLLKHGCAGSIKEETGSQAIGRLGASLGDRLSMPSPRLGPKTARTSGKCMEKQPLPIICVSLHFYRLHRRVTRMDRMSAPRACRLAFGDV